MQQIKGLLITRGRQNSHLTSEIVTLDNSLHGIYKAMNVDCIEVPVVGNGWQMIVDEEGKINGKWLPTMSGENFGLRDTLWGPILFLGLTDDGDCCSITEEQQEEILSLAYPNSKTWVFRF